jgi:hypothetical protein
LQVGVQPLERCLALNHGTYEIDLVVLIDGRTDSLIFGDEHSTIVEDAVSTVAAYTTARNQVIFAVIGFGVDHLSGVPHYAFFENVALFETADFLAHFRLRLTGQRTRPFSISSTTPTAGQPQHQSIVCNSIASVLQGEFGDSTRPAEPGGSELFINPLTPLWAHRVATNMAYAIELAETERIEDARLVIERRREALQLRPRRQLPL